MSSVTTRAARCLLALSLCAVGAGCARASQAASVTILVPWSGAEYQAFLKVIEPFEQQYGVQVNAESSRALTQDLDADLDAHDPPDLADLPSPAAEYQYQKEGKLEPLSIDLSSYDQPWRGLAELGKSTVYAVPVKADVKGLLWYDTSTFGSRPPRTWAALEGLSGHGTPWCLGLASTSTSGWPGADWVAQILLSRYPVGMYKNWLGGGLLWTSAEVRNAWTTWGMLTGYDGDAINGGVVGALKTTFNQAAGGMASGKCELEHGALSATGLKSTAGYGYVPFPSISGAPSPVLVSGDFMSLFTDNPNAENLLAYLASYKAQKLWVEQTDGGYAFSADQIVAPASYPTDVQRKIAGQFLQADGTMLCFSAEDMMQPDMSSAFEQAVLDFIDKPSLLSTLLGELQTTQNGTRPSPLANRACAQP